MTNTLPHTELQDATAADAATAAAFAVVASAATAANTALVPQATEINTTNTAIASQQATETIHNSQEMIRSVETQTQTYKDTISFQNDVFAEIIQKCENIKENIQNSNIFVLISTLEFQIHLLLQFISTNYFTQTQFASIKFKFITIAQILNQIADNS